MSTERVNSANKALNFIRKSQRGQGAGGISQFPQLSYPNSTIIIVISNHQSLAAE
jgi:hypothetical protein